MTIDWKHVEYLNAHTFLQIMKAWAAEVGWTPADIEQQERIVAECEAEVLAARLSTTNTADDRGQV